MICITMIDKRGDINLGNRLKRLRSQKGLTQKQLFELSTVSLATIRKVETGGRFLSRDSAEKLAKVLGTSESFLFYGVESDPDKPKSRIPDLPPDEPPLTPEEAKYLEEPYGVYLSVPYLSRLSNKQRRQIANLVRDMVEGGDEEE